MIDDLAQHPDPSALHARLRARGVHRTADGRWVVASARDVAAVLHAPGAVIGFAPDADRPVTALQAQMARFSDGDAHARRRAHARRLLAQVDPGALRDTAAATTRAHLAGLRRTDVMTGIARRVPVATLAAALGVDDPAAAVTATAHLARALAPPRGARPVDARCAAQDLQRVLAHTAPPGAGRDEALANAIALLFQAFDATAGLVGNAVLTMHRLPGTAAEDIVAATARHDAPVQLTTRVAAHRLAPGDRSIPAGARVVVVLAAAATDGHSAAAVTRHATVAHAGATAGVASPSTFGAGRHACPGADHALALAAGVLDALATAGTLVRTTDVAYEPRANLRIPRSLVVDAPGGTW